jgi:outer membrane receptor for ferrienterochelin and colicins
MRHKLALYGSAQTVNRDSYYGAGGRIIQPGESVMDDELIAINAYGTSSDIAIAGGAQYAFVMNDAISLTTGSEWQFNHVDDAMPGYNRSIQQKVRTLGNYGQLQWLPLEQLTILAGARFDAVYVDGEYLLGESNFENDRNQTVFVPRLSFMYNITETLKARLSLAQGYRAPQAFDEDLHIETVGGAARFIQLSPDLQLERSNSITASMNYTKIVGLVHSSLVLEYFYTHLDNPFILSDPTELPNGVGVITKRNGSGAYVQGINLEMNWAIGSNWVVQSGVTFQKALYEVDEVIWSPSDPSDTRPETTTSDLLRTPNQYGYLTLNYTPNKALTFSYTGVYTGSMSVPHMIDPETEYTVIKQSPTFFEQNIKANWQFRIKDGYKLDCFFGVQNLTNSFQRDFDVGPDRDPAYVYGPMRPRTIYTGIKVGF